MEERFAYHVEKDVEAIGLSGVSRDDDDESGRVDGARFCHDRSFPRETKGLTRVTDCVLARPETVGNQHCEEERRNNPSQQQVGKRKVNCRRNERVQRPFTATVALKNDLVIFSCFSMKTVSALVRFERPSTEATPVPVAPIRRHSRASMIRSAQTNVG